jgi:hypothetical protein
MRFDERFDENSRKRLPLRWALCFCLEGGKGGGGAVCRTDSSLYAHTAPFGRAVLLSDLRVHSLPLGKERTKKTRQGTLPLATPFPSARFCSATLRRACGLLDSKTVPSWAHKRTPKMGLAGDLCLTLGELAPRISKKGECGSKPTCQTEGGHQCAFVGGKSLDFPTRFLDSPQSFSQPRKNVDKHFCLGAEISIAPAPHHGNPKGRALWSAFLVRSFSDEKE